MVVLSLRAHGQTARFHSRAVLLSAFGHLAWFPLFAAASAGLPHDAYGYVAAAACASLIHAAILAPFALFVPAHLTVPPRVPGGPPFPMPSLDHALAQWDRLPWVRRFALLAFRVVPVVASFALFFVCRLWFSWLASFTLASFVYGVGVFVYAEAAAKAHMQTRREDDVPVASARYLYLPAFACVLLGAVLFGYGVVAATEASPMTLYEGPVAENEFLNSLVNEGAQRVPAERGTLPNTDIRIDPFTGGVTVETADGGGAGRINVLSPHEEEPENFYMDLWFTEDAEGFDVYQQSNGWRYFTIDRTGVRTDDGLARRLRHGLGRSALLFFGAGLLLIALCVWLVASAARVRRRLVAIRSVEELETPQCTGALEGTFHGKAYNVSAIEALKIIQVKGEGEIRAHLGGNLLRFRLPAEGTSGVGVPKDGESVTLTGVFPVLQAQLREASVEWPSDALLLTGDKDSAAKGLVQRALRPALVVLALAGASWTATLFSVFLHRL